MYDGAHGCPITDDGERAGAPGVWLDSSCLHVSRNEADAARSGVAATDEGGLSGHLPRDDDVEGVGRIQCEPQSFGDPLRTRLWLPGARAQRIAVSVPALLAIGLGTLLFLLVVAKLYWFSTPFRGVCVALLCYVGSIVLSRWRVH